MQTHKATILGNEAHVPWTAAARNEEPGMIMSAFFAL
jgi:hypothetical protein